METLPGREATFQGGASSKPVTGCPAVTWKQGCWEQALVSPRRAGTCSTRRDVKMEKTRPGAQLLTLSTARVCPHHIRGFSGAWC